MHGGAIKGMGLATITFLYGLAAEEQPQEKLGCNDSYFDVLIAASAVKNETML